MNSNTQFESTVESHADTNLETVDIELSIADLDLIGGGTMVDVFL